MRISLGSWALTGTLTCLTLGLASWTAGCGGGGAAAPITEDQFCQQKADKECQVTVKCGTASMSACATQRKAACLTVAAGSKTAPRVFHPENVPACVNKTATVYAKTTTITPAELDDMNDVCAYVFQGNSTTTCAVKYDCTGTKICDKGICSVKVIKALAALCGNPGEVCAAGAYCAPNPAGANALTCLAKGAQSAPCSDTVPCLETLRCDGATHLCVPRLMASETCLNDDECGMTAPYCDPYIGHKCDLGLSFSGGAPACADYGAPASTGTGGSAGGTGGASGSTDAGAGDAASGA